MNHNNSNIVNAHDHNSTASQLLNNKIDKFDRTSWPDPEPLQRELLPVLPLEHNLIPQPLRDWINDIAERMQCPID